MRAWERFDTGDVLKKKSDVRIKPATRVDGTDKMRIKQRRTRLVWPWVE